MTKISSGIAAYYAKVQSIGGLATQGRYWVRPYPGAAITERWGIQEASLRQLYWEAKKEHLLTQEFRNPIESAHRILRLNKEDAKQVCKEALDQQQRIAQLLSEVGKIDERVETAVRLSRIKILLLESVDKLNKVSECLEFKLRENL